MTPSQLVHECLEISTRSQQICPIRGARFALPDLEVGQQATSRFELLEILVGVVVTTADLLAVVFSERGKFEEVGKKIERCPVSTGVVVVDHGLQ